MRKTESLQIFKKMVTNENADERMQLSVGELARLQKVASFFTARQFWRNKLYYFKYLSLTFFSQDVIISGVGG